MRGTYWPYPIRDPTADERSRTVQSRPRSRRVPATANPAALPRSFNEGEFKKDAELVDALYPVVMAVRQLADSVEDTFALAASEAYAGALVVYRSLRDNDAEGLFEEAVDDLSVRFARKSGKKPATQPAPGSEPPAATA